MIVFDPPHPGSIVHHLDPRVRIVGFLVMGVTACVCDRMETLGCLLACSCVLLIAALPPRRRTVKRLLAVNSFMALTICTLPWFVPGVAILSAGSFSFSREGLMQAMMIAMKGNAIMIACFALIATIEPARLAHALWRLRLPRRLITVLMLQVRYIEVVHDEHHRLHDAMTARGFRPGFDMHTLRSYAHLVTMMIILSLRRAEQVLAAMRCRGFDGRFHCLTTLRLRARDGVFIALLSCTSAILLMWEHAL
jgi:cobalt/nickel transport system permease protein